MRAIRKCLGGLAAGGLLAMAMSPAFAFNVASFWWDPSQASKWGASNQIGTAGGVVTWSLIPDETGIQPDAPVDGLSGTSNLSSVFAQVGGETAALGMIEEAFEAWSSVANLSFVRVTDDGTPFNAPYDAGQSIGHIRIGAYAMDGFTGAVGYVPPPNGGTTLEGDIVFNASNTFGIAPGNEGDLYELYPESNGFFYLNDFQGLFTHELGHALGMLHSGVPTALMCGYVDPAFDGSQCAYMDPDGDGKSIVNRVPDADDVAGIQYLYGAPPPVPEPGTCALAIAGLGLLLARMRRR